MAGKWQSLTVDELKARDERAVAIGPFGSRMKADAYVATGVPVIRGNNLSDTRALTGDFVFVSPQTADELRACNVFADDLVFPHRGAIGQVGIVPDDGTERYMLSTSLMKLSCNRELVEPRFLFYFFRSWLGRHALLQHASTVGTPGIGQPLSSLRSIRVPVPPLDEQRAIAHILGTLDDKIELNRRMSETLEAMARALFKSWFIDFDPVRRNAARARNQPSPGASRRPLPGGEGHYRGGYDFAGLVETARTLRRKQTSAEAIFWELLRDRRFLGLKFRRQHQLGDYIADFYCHEHRLAIELDGGVHSAKQKKDHKRDAWMQAQGFTVLRFPNEILLDDPEAVLSAIAEAVLPSPSGRGAGGEGSVEELDRLFPARLIDSELGEIPEGWDVGTLGDVAALNPEVWTKQTRPSEIEYIDLANTKWGRIEAVTSYATDDAPSRAQRVLRQGDTIVGTVRPGNGSYAFISDDELTGSTGFAVLRPQTAEYREFVYLAATAADNIDALAHLADGAAYPAVRPEVVAATPIVRPNHEVVGQFSRASGSLLAKIASSEREARTLADLRDTLLPKLISGELRVSPTSLLDEELPAIERRQ